MKNQALTVNLMLAVFTLCSGLSFAQVRTIEDFENTNGWTFNKADGVNVKLSNEKGVTGNAIRLDYDFTKGTGFGGIQKLFPIDLPENFEFSFYVKAESPANNFEIKFIDSTGNNVWWVNNRNYTFPSEWKKITIKKRHINFAWGPTADQSLKRIDRIEFTIASYLGGKGTLWLDDLRFEPLPPETTDYPIPDVKAASSAKDHQPSFMTDNSASTWWRSKDDKPQEVIFDLKGRREFGGLRIDWLEGHYAVKYDILFSSDGKKWENAYSVASNGDNVSFIRLPEAETNFLKIALRESAAHDGFGIKEVNCPGIRNSLSMNDFLIYCAKNSPMGNYPRYFLEQAEYWTISGVNNDVKEALFSEDGMVEVDKAGFSIEPMIKEGENLYNWSNVVSEKSMGDRAGFKPTVSWDCKGLKFKTAVISVGEANKSSVVGIEYTFENKTAFPRDFSFYLLLRPFQVDPYYQTLNITGGASRISSIQQEPDGIAVDGKTVFSERKIDMFGSLSWDQGNMVDMIREGSIPASNKTEDPNAMASGLMMYSISLKPGQSAGFWVVVPFYGKEGVAEKMASGELIKELNKAPEFWKEKTGHIEFNLPYSAERIINTYRSNLAYILINRDKAGIQPGSRSYERSWIRDGALTSSLLLKSGIVPEVKDFIRWYAGHQYENGKVPCVVDFRGPDPVPENDSHGEFIYLIREYFNFSKDTAFLEEMNPRILKAVDYIEYLVAQRSTDYYRNGNDSVRAQYGLVPESISHEGYSAKPMHSYWDDFFTMKGLKDAAEIQNILGNKSEYERIAKTRDTFRDNLYNSINLAMKVKNINYIPGCAELGDFDATSTTIALTPCNELKNLPKPEVYNTFDKYYEYFKNRRDGTIEWDKYTPYENRLIGSFIMLDEPDRAHELIDFFLNDQLPQEWNHWAEVVWKDHRHAGYIGDMPHTWVGSDFLNAIRTMFIYENEYDQSLVLGAALYQDWIDAPEGMSVSNLPTYYGEISYSVKKVANKYTVTISGNLDLPENGIKIRNFNGSKMPSRVSVNGKDIMGFSNKDISVGGCPAVVEIYY
jgi:hypothetical protein